MNKLFTILLLFISLSVCISQTSEIRVFPVSPGNYEIQMRITSGNVPQTAYTMSNLSFSLEWPTAAALVLGNPSGIYGMVKEGGVLISGANSYQVFNSSSALSSSPFPQNWTLNSFVVLMTITSNPTTPLPIVKLGSAELSYFDENFSFFVTNPDIVLPIRLQSFTAKKFAANTSLLEWTTASEDNASHIEIERSMDAKSWSYVATEKARGSLNYNTDYSFVDAEAVLQRDRFTTVYYRLKLVDNDGFSEYSEVRSVTFDNNGIVSLEAYPNPSTEVINLRMAVGETNTNTAQMMMLDMTGKLVKKQTVSANGISVLEVDQLETGVYNIIVKHEDKTYQKRVIKTN